MDKKLPLTLYLAEPRGFCAGVDRAIQIVEKAIEKYGAPVYVRHEIVHNKFVVDDLKAKGAIFVDELDEIPNIHHDRPVIFSAHGVPKSVPEEAGFKNMFYIDATCPLVSKVHRETERHHKNAAHVILIGHQGHPEVIGTMGQIPEGSITLVETLEDIEKLPTTFDNLAYVTQTTLSVDDTQEIVDALTQKYPHIHAPFKEDICYATTNRQSAVKQMAERCDLLMVIGASNSSNSNRLVEVARNYGAKSAKLIRDASDIKAEWLDGVKEIGLTAGASAPDILIKEVIETLQAQFDLTIEHVSFAKENVTFKLPRAVAC